MNGQPRVLQVVLSLEPGGTERLVIELVKRLHDRMPMAICCLDKPGAWSPQLQSEGISVTALDRQPGFHPLLGAGVARVAKKHRATVIHAHHYSPFVYSALGRFWGGPPVIFTEHGRLSDAGPSSKRRVANQLLSFGASHVYTVSRELGAHLVQEGFRESAVSTIYNGIDVGPPIDAEMRRDVRSRLGVDENVLVVGTVARLDPVKDLGTLIQAASLVRPSDSIVLVIVGDGDERVRLERVARDHDVADGVRFLGHRDDARSWLAGCDVYANSSVSEGISLTILEGMAAGLPIVATAVGGTSEIVNTSCGRLVPARSPRALASALEELARDPDARRSLGRAARARVEHHFTIQHMVDSYALVYAG
jgi:L-malate glycosyltransferase